MTGLIFHLLAHTHWDREWYLPAAGFRARLVGMVDDLFERLQADPQFRSFLLDGQTVLLEDYLRVRPDREAEIRTLVKTGRLQIGPWYVLADEQIPSGEALIRNLLVGALDAERFGGRTDVLYSPDAFGHPAIWPTLGREFGMRSGVLWRGLGGEPGQERDLYRWHGVDERGGGGGGGGGGGLLVYHLPPAGYEIGAALPADRDRLPEAWARVRPVLVERAESKHIPVFVGGDHHWAHPAVGRLRDLLAELEPENAFRVSRLDEFFQAAGADPGKPPRLTGELRWSYRYAWTLQGVHGTRAPLKRRNSELEVWLERVAEPLAALARRTGGPDRRPLLEHAWRTLLRCQFHDSLGGCASDAVAEAMAVRFEAVAAMARELTREGLFDFVRHDPDAARERPTEQRPALVLWNPAARQRRGVVIADLTFFRRDVLVGPPGNRSAREAAGTPAPFCLTEPGGGGRRIPLQLLDRRPGQERIDARRHYPDQDDVDVVRVALRAPPVPGLGAVVASVAGAVGAGTGDAVEDRVAVRARSLANRYLEVTLESSGALALWDKRSGEWYFAALQLEDAGDAGDTYTAAPAAGDRVVRSTGPIKVRRLAAGPLAAALEATWAMRAGTNLAGGSPRHGRIAVRLVVMLLADSRAVRCILEIDNRAANHRLRARVPLDLPETAAVAGSQFGSITRPAVVVDPALYPMETPVATAPAHRFVAAADRARGLAILAPGFFEYEWTPAGHLLVTLLRAVGQLSRGDLPTRPGHAGWPRATPLAQCPGMTRVELALLPVSQAELERGDVVPQAWEDVFLPVRGFFVRDAVALQTPPVDVTLEGPGLVLSAVKPAQAGSTMVLRCYNATGRKAAGVWRFGDGVKSAHRVRADERESVALVLESRGKVVRFTAEPHEIVTILVT